MTKLEILEYAYYYVAIEHAKAKVNLLDNPENAYAVGREIELGEKMEELRQMVMEEEEKAGV